MSPSPILTIDLKEEFPHLPKAPIVEAVIDLRARAQTEWTELSISEALKPRLPDYPKKQSMSGFQQQFVLGPGVSPEAKTVDTGWSGMRLQTSDDLHIAQFNRDGFQFARLRPYEKWERLLDEAMRLWTIFVEVARPAEIQRVGLRFINRIDLPFRDARIEDYLDPGPQGPRDLALPIQHFFYQETFAVPGHGYAVRLIRTIQPQQGPDPQSVGLILDTDVFTTQPFELATGVIERRLAEMRWLKNKVFFGNVTSKALETFK